MGDIKITFFMMVTDPDLIIANDAVRSYAKIKDIPFKLLVYSNWISSGLKQRYFPAWRQFDFVEIAENERQTDENKPTDPKLDGPFELYDTIWDRELKKITTPYVATVDADFEILDANFIPVMLKELDANPNLIAMSTDYFPKEPAHYDAYSGEVICLNERWDTWFCIYKREAFQCPVSHAYYEEITTGPVRRNAWDSAGYFQKTLKDTYGYELAVLDSKYQPCFIHYGAFSKNRDINDKNVALYRTLQILRKKGLFGNGNAFARKLDNLLTKTTAEYLDKVLFGHVDRLKYWAGWSKR